MTEAPQKLSYTVAGYDDRAANGLLIRRLLPSRQRDANTRYAFLLLLAITFTFWVSQVLGPRLGNSAYVYFLGILLLAVPIFWIAAFRGQRSRVLAAFANAPAWRGTTALSTTDEGLTFATDGSRSTLFWSGIADTIEGKDGLLVLPGDAEFIPIPASAFKSEAEKHATLSDLRARLARTKGEDA